MIDRTAEADLVSRLADRDQEIAALRRELEAWRADYRAQPLRDDTDFTSISGRRVEPVYSPIDTSNSLGNGESGLFPGQYPYTRGIHPTMYRGRLWTMRQFAGFGTATDTN